MVSELESSKTEVSVILLKLELEKGQAGLTVCPANSLMSACQHSSVTLFATTYSVPLIKGDKKEYFFMKTDLPTKKKKQASKLTAGSSGDRGSSGPQKATVGTGKTVTNTKNKTLTLLVAPARDMT